MDASTRSTGMYLDHLRFVQRVNKKDDMVRRRPTSTNNKQKLRAGGVRLYADSCVQAWTQLVAGRLGGQRAKRISVLTHRAPDSDVTRSRVRPSDKHHLSGITPRPRAARLGVSLFLINKKAAIFSQGVFLRVSQAPLGESPSDKDKDRHCSLDNCVCVSLLTLTLHQSVIFCDFYRVWERSPRPRSQMDHESE